MDDENINSSKMSISEIVARYNSDNSFSLEKAIPVNIITENKDIDGTSIVVKNPEGNCLIIKANNSFFLVPRKDYNFSTHQLNSLRPFFYFQEYKRGKTKEFIIQEPAQVSWTGKDWKSEKSGTLNFNKDSLSNLSEDSTKQIEEYLAEINEKNQEIEKLEEEKKHIQQEYQILQKKYKSIQEEQEQRNNSDHTRKQLHNELKTFKESILNQISDRVKQELNHELNSCKVSRAESTSDRVYQQVNYESEDIKKLVQEGISDYFQQEINDSSLSIHSIIKEELDKYIQREFNVYLPSFIEAIQEKFIYNFCQESSKKGGAIPSLIREINSKLSSLLDRESKISEEINSNEIRNIFIQENNNQLQFLQDSLAKINSRLSSISDISEKILEKQINENIAHFSKESDIQLNEIMTSLKRLRASFDNLYELTLKINQQLDKNKNIGFFVDQPISTNNLEDDISLITTYKKHPEKLLANATKVAATGESIEKKRAGLKTPIIFTEANIHSYWIVQELPLQDECFYLVPKANLIINDRIYQTIEDIFVCQNYFTRSSNKFELKEPAIVKLASDYENMWELVKPGKLVFS